MEKTMRMILEGKDCGFAWSASHLLPGHYKCSRMHGHNYVMNIEIESDTLKNGMIIDFVKIKKKVREFIEKYDHRLLLPEKPNNQMIANEGDFIRIKYNIKEDEMDEQTAIIDRDTKRFKQKEYLIPKMDVFIVPDVSVITAETLSLHFKEEIKKLLSMDDSKYNFYVTIFEDAGQGVRA